MAFAKPLASMGMFGLPGLALSGAFKKDKKKEAPPPGGSFVTEGGGGRATNASLIGETRQY